MSKISIHGNLTADPNLRFSDGGNAWVTFQVAENHRAKKGDTWGDLPPEFHSVKAFGHLAENIGESLKKGDRVVVVGVTTTRAYTPEGSKESVTVSEIVADEVGASLQYATAKISRNAKAEAAPDQEVPQYDEADVPPAK